MLCGKKIISIIQFSGCFLYLSKHSLRLISPGNLAVLIFVSCGASVICAVSTFRQSLSAQPSVAVLTIDYLSSKVCCAAKLMGAVSGKKQ
jgi:hypothetical protein